MIHDMLIGLYGTCDDECNDPWGIPSADYHDYDRIPADSLPSVYQDVPSEYLATLGQIMLFAADLDVTLDLVLMVLVKPKRVEVSSILFDGETFSWKIDKCKRLIDANPDITLEARAYLKNLLDDAKGLLDERNKYAHSASWVYIARPRRCLHVALAGIVMVRNGALQ